MPKSQQDQPLSSGVDRLAQDGDAPSPDTTRLHVQRSSPTGVAGLNNESSQSHPRDVAGTKSLSGQDGAPDPQAAQSPTRVMRDGDPGDSRAENDSEVGEWHSSVSDAERSDDGQFDPGRGRMEMIDRIMKSFCVSLDSKIAAIKETSGSPVVKQERELESPKPSLKQAGPASVRFRRTRKKRGSPPGRVEHSLVVESAAAPSSSGARPRTRGSTTAVLPLVSRPAPAAAPPRVQPQAPAPTPLASPRRPRPPRHQLFDSLELASSPLSPPPAARLAHLGGVPLSQPPRVMAPRPGNLEPSNSDSLWEEENVAPGRRAEDAHADNADDNFNADHPLRLYEVLGFYTDHDHHPQSIAFESTRTPQPAGHSPLPASYNMPPPRPDHTAQVYIAPPQPESQHVSEEEQVAQRTKRVVDSEAFENHPIRAIVHEEADGDGRRKKTKRASGGSTGVKASGDRKFACPYFKRNPRKFRKWTSCPGPGWDEVHRVKTHLYRRHPLPIQCPRCWEAFKTDGELQSHLQKDPPCAIQGNRTLQEGFTKDQEKRLRSRKKAHTDMTDEDKWREIFMILFPDDDPSAIPSPHYNDDEDESEKGSLHGSGELEDYATFIRREMPALVRRELETLFQEEFRDVEERIRPRVADIVLNLQPRLLGLYKQSQMPLSDYGPQQHEGTTSGSEPTLTPAPSQNTDPGNVTDPNSTPDMVSGVEAAPGFRGSSLDANWDMLYPGNQAQAQGPETDGSLELDWDVEFDKLLNPMLFLPPPEAQSLSAGWS